MAYYIDSQIGKIYFDSHNLLKIRIYNYNHFIERKNIRFVDEAKFFEFIEMDRWMCMEIATFQNIACFVVHESHNKYYTLNIYNNIYNQKSIY
jgi:hypothetical protein